MKLSSLLSSVVAAVALTASVSAQAAPSAASSEQTKDYITGYVGYFDVIRNNYESTQLGLEYRAKPIQYNLRPMFGVNVTTDDSVYGYAGLNWDVALLDHQLYLIPNFAVGLYRKGDGKELGGPIEFRSGIELAYQLPNTHRLGVAFNHVSNASIYKHNPGSETLLVNYSIPMASLR